MFVWPVTWFTCPPDCGTGNTATTCCGEVNCNCNLCGTPFAKDYMGGCSPGCTNCGGKGNGKGGCCPNPLLSFECYNDKAPKPWDYQIYPQDMNVDGRQSFG